MKIAIGADHGGFVLKEVLAGFLKSKGHHVIDVGCFCKERCDYPQYSFRAAGLVSNKIADRGILICKSGIGHSIVANKLKGVRAALCRDITQAKSSREHNDANVLVMGALYTKKNLAKRMVSVWLKTAFLGERHAQRIKQIETIESKLYRRQA